MLKMLLHPLLALLLLGTTSYYTISSRAAAPLEIKPPMLQPTAAPEAGPSAAPAALVAQPQPKLKDVDAILVIDNSGSMFGYTCVTRKPVPANDAENLRLRGAEIIIRALAADLKPRETKLGLVTFGNKAELVKPLTQLSNDDSTVRSELVAAIQNPPCQGETNIVDAIAVAQAELQSARATAGNTPAIIFLTDGAPTVGGLEDVIAQQLDRLGDVRFYAILLGKDPSLQAFKKFWQAEAEHRPNVTVYALNSNSEIPDLYKDIATDLNGATKLAQTATFPASANVSVPIPANVQQAVLTVLKPTSSVVMTLQDPSGKDVEQLPADRFRALSRGSTVEVFVIQRPEPGDWKVSAPGGESLLVLQPEFKSIYEVRLLQPDALSLLPVDQPATMRVQVIDNETHTPIAGEFTLAVTYRPQGGAATAPVDVVFDPESADQAIYTSSIPANTFRDGEHYLFALTVQDQQGLRSVPTEYLLVAGFQPILSGLNAVPLRAFVDQSVVLRATVAHAESAGGKVLPQLAQALPGGATPVFTSNDAKTFEATLPPFERPGSYSLTVVYRGKTLTERDFSSTQTVTVSVVERSQTILLRVIALIISLLVGFYLAFRYLLLRPLVPVFQRIGLAPQGYIRIQGPDERYPETERNLKTILQERRRLFRLSIGPDNDIPLIIANPSSDEEDQTQSRPGWRTRLFGKPALGHIGRSLGGRTFIRKRQGVPREFSNASNIIDIENNQIEYSLTSIENADDTNV